MHFLLCLFSADGVIGSEAPYLPCYWIVGAFVMNTIRNLYALEPVGHLLVSGCLLWWSQIGLCVVLRSEGIALLFQRSA